MLARFFLPIFSILGMLLGLISVILNHQPPPMPPILFPPPISPFKHYIAAVGVIEPSSSNIAIGTSDSGEITEVYVTAGDFVPKGAPLFKLDTAVLEKELIEVQENLEVARAKYERLLDLPNSVDIPPLEDKVDALQANYLDKLAQFELVENITRPGAISRDEFNIRKFAALKAKFELKDARDTLNQTLAGAWIRDLDIARAEVRVAAAAVEVKKQQIKDHTSYAPFSGVVLATDINVGEVVTLADNQGRGLVLFGVLDPLHLKVEVDEQDIWRVIPGAPGRAFVRGNSNISVPLKYVKLEPALVRKRNLSGSITELVDTRVLKLTYEFNPNDLPLYSGQLMDVFIESKPHFTTTKGEEDANQ